LAVGVEELEEGKDQHKKCTAKSWYFIHSGKGLFGDKTFGHVAQ
jgi:hypothetical protein